MNRAERKAKTKQESLHIKRVRETEGWRASMKLAFQYDWANFKKMPLWQKPFHVLRVILATLFLILFALVAGVIAAVVLVVGFIILMFAERFWQTFALLCLGIGVVVLFATGVF